MAAPPYRPAQDPTHGPDKIFAIFGTIERIALSRLTPDMQRALCLGQQRKLDSPAFWRGLQTGVTQPIEASMAAEVAAEEGDAERALQLAVDAAQALATRPCAHACCTTVLGFSEAAAGHGKRCAGCEVVRYCCKACQNADWRAHKAACRELRRRPSGSKGAE